MTVLNSFGASFSIKYAREMNIDAKSCLNSGLKELRIKKLRLMSYWDEHEQERGTYDFEELDWQFELAKRYDVKISLAIGLRQPRWPESHWPAWAQDMDERHWQKALNKFISNTVNRYKNHPNLESWQLENEALLKTFGLNGNFSRIRIQEEYKLVKKLDKAHPVIMTTSDSWGIPFRQPRPDLYGISIYRRFYDRGEYRQSKRPALFFKIRGWLIKLITGKDVFIHELQTEPWGPSATSNLSLNEQKVTMNAVRLREAVYFAEKTGLMPAYLWGLEWWYWLKVKYDDDSLWHTAEQIFSANS